MTEENSQAIKSLIVVYSYHHMNTAKVAAEMAKVLSTQVKSTNEVKVEELINYDLIGLGAGIDSGKHYSQLLDLADQLPQANQKQAFIFSTCGVYSASKMAKDHSKLREKLVAKGYIVLDEFGCQGLDTNSFLKYVGGINKGRPNSEDLRNAREFALSLIEQRDEK